MRDRRTQTVVVVVVILQLCLGCSKEDGVRESRVAARDHIWSVAKPKEDCYKRETKTGMISSVKPK